MEIVRKYKKISTLRFLELIDIEMKHTPTLEEYIAFFDELKMRKLESISEGEIFKIKRQAKNLLEHIEARIASEPEWSGTSAHENFRKLAAEV